MAGVIVVGVDGSPNGWNARDWAIEEAKLRGASLKVVCCFEDPMTTVGIGTAFTAGAPIAVDPDLVADAAKEVANEAVQRVGEQVQVQTLARCDRPGDVLSEESKGAALLVVGSRGHSAVGSILLGSVSNHVVHHSSCPVVVVPHPR